MCGREISWTIETDCRCGIATKFHGAQPGKITDLDGFLRPENFTFDVIFGPVVCAGRQDYRRLAGLALWGLVLGYQAAQAPGAE